MTTPDEAVPDWVTEEIPDRSPAEVPLKPVPLSVNVDGVPDAWKRERRWVGWKYVLRHNSDGELRWTKPPYVATATSREARTNDPSTWSTFDDALAAYHDGKVDGIGIVLHKEWVAYDQDHSLDLTHITLLNTYTERSVSGGGLHAIATGEKPGKRCKAGPFELYDHQTNKYFTVTGHRLPEFPAEVQHRQAEIAALYAKLFPNGDSASGEHTGHAHGNSITDADLIAKATAKGKFSRLWAGDVSGYASHSEADLALCSLLAFWSNRDPARIDRLFRQSGLMREKWNERRGDSTIGADLIAKAIASTPNGYTGPKTETRRDEPAEDLHAFLIRVDSQPPLSWFIPGLIPDEGICLWHGQPRDFKTMCAQEVALALAAGRPAFNLARFAVTRKVTVCYFTEEDPERLFAARMHWLTAKAKMPDEGCFFPFIRKSLTFDSEEDQRYILRKILETRAEVTFIDPVRSFTAHSDKGPADLRPVAKFLRQIQNETPSKTLTLVHHDTKPLAVTPNGQERPRSQQASGGGILSISDCPVAFEKLDWNKVAVYPEDYKLSGNPKPFEVTFETDERNGDDGPRFGSWVRPVATTKEERDIKDDAAAKKILTFLRSKPDEWHSTDEARKGAHLRNEDGALVLEQLHKEGKVRFCTGEDAKALGRSPKAKLWAATDERREHAEF